MPKYEMARASPPETTAKVAVHLFRMLVTSSCRAIVTEALMAISFPLLDELSVQANNNLATNVPSPIELNLSAAAPPGWEKLRSAARNFPRPLNDRNSDALPTDWSSVPTPARLSLPSRLRAEIAGCSPGECADADRPRNRPDPGTKLYSWRRRPAAACNRRS